MQRVRRRGEERAHGEVALGDPWPLVEEPRGGIERLDIDLDDRGAERGEVRERRLVGRLRDAIAEE
jgi:hypothetical protein